MAKKTRDKMELVAQRIMKDLKADDYLWGVINGLLHGMADLKDTHPDHDYVFEEEIGSIYAAFTDTVISIVGKQVANNLADAVQEIEEKTEDDKNLPY